jgi:alkylglycerol monooxygenase
MKFHLIAFGVPIIFTIIGLEYYFSQRKGKKYFSFTSSISNISIGIAERLAQLFLAGYFILVFQFVYDHFAIFHIKQNTYTWILLFFLTDLIWYWYHRLSHEVNILWGAHIVHHSSEEYNYTVSLRITIYQSFIRLGFGLLLPIIGFPVPMLLISITVLGIYQFFIHTRFVKSLGFLETIFVTPSNHRVHHGSNEIYLDKNYGGILIIWDKLFGTYQSETEEVRYGLTKQVKSNSFLWLHFHYWLELIEHVKASVGIANKIKILFGSPSKLKLTYEKKLRNKYLSETNLASSQINKENYPQLYYYIEAQLLFSLALLFVMYLIDLPAFTNFLFSVIITTTIINCGAILEQKKWVFKIEILRFIAVYILIVLFTKQIFLYAFAPVILMFFIEDYRLFKHLYFKRLYKRK